MTRGVTGDPAGLVAAVLRDLSLPGDPPARVEVAEHDLHGDRGLVVTVTDPDTGLSAGFLYPSFRDTTHLLAEVADRLQDALVDVFAAQRPACRVGGHDHVLFPAVRAGRAVWRCPRGGWQVEVTRYHDPGPGDAAGQNLGGSA